MDRIRLVRFSASHHQYCRYPLRDGALLDALKSTLSQLAHWCPLFSEVSFLPALAFPFVKLMRHATSGSPSDSSGIAVDSTAAFETVATLICNWARHWFEMFPHPPLRYLEKFSGLLEYHDPEVAAHMSRWDGGTSAVGWDLLSSLLTDVLGRQEWLKVWYFMALHALHINRASLRLFQV